MKSKWAYLLTLKLIIILSMSCAEKKKETPVSFSGNEIMDLLDRHFENLHSLKLMDIDFEASAVAINDSIHQNIKKITSHEQMLQAYEHAKSKMEGFTFLVSDNNTLGVFSWDSRLGGSMPDFQNEILVASNRGVSISVLSENHSIEKIHTLPTKNGDTLYLFRGWGKQSTIEFYKALDAYSAKDSLITPYNAFPNQSHSLRVDYSINDLEEADELDFKLANNGKDILIPELYDQGMVYHPIRFNGSIYIKVFGKYAKELKDKDFTPNRIKSKRFLKGLEAPMATNAITNGKIYTYDSLQIKEITNNVNELTEIELSSENKESKSVAFESYAEFVGKKNQYLFFDEGGVAENWLLSIYDMQQHKKTLSLYVSHAIVEEEKLIFARRNDAIPKEKKESLKDCALKYGDQTGYFETYSLDYTEEPFVIKPIANYFCGFVE